MVAEQTYIVLNHGRDISCSKTLGCFEGQIDALISKILAMPGQRRSILGPLASDADLQGVIFGEASRVGHGEQLKGYVWVSSVNS
jgi:hypothetical protein